MVGSPFASATPEGLIPYPSYKPSGSDWLGHVPAHWEVRRLRNVVDLRVSNVDKHVRDGEQAVRLCNYVDVYKHESIGREIDYMAATATADEVARFKLATGDVLITKDSEDWTDIGVPAVVEGVPDDVLCGYHLVLLRTRSGLVQGRFLLRALQTKAVASQFYVRANGVTRYGLSHDAIKSISLAVPPIVEQAAIARFLDYATRSIGQYTRAKEELITLQEERHRTFVRQAVIGQIDVRTGRPHPAYKASGLSWLGDIPEHWQMVRNGRLFAQRNETGHPELPILEVSLRSGVRVRDFENSNRKQVMSDRSLYKRAAKDDVAYNMMRMWQGAVGVAPTDGLVSPAYVVAKPMPGVDSRYFDHLFHTRVYMTEVDKYSRGIVKDRNRLYWEDFKQMPTPRPPSEEQAVIADAVDSQAAETSACIRNMRSQISLAQEYHTRLIDDVATGKLDVRDAAARLPNEPDNRGALERDHSLADAGKDRHRPDGNTPHHGEAAIH